MLVKAKMPPSCGLQTRSQLTKQKLKMKRRRTRSNTNAKSNVCSVECNITGIAKTVKATMYL